MTIQTVGLLSPGDMGHSIGAVLHDHGLRVITCFEGRSERSRTLAAEAGIEDGGSMDDVVQAADIFLSVLVPASAREVAGRVAASLRATGSSLLYVDCNAVSPATVREVAETITAAGGEIADVGIVGPPPRKPGTRFYASGPGAERLTELREFGLDIRVIGDEIGQASGLKMCYGAMTKGLTALATELLVAAKLMGLEDVLRAEQESSMTEVLGWVAGMTPTMPPKAYRWVGEMEEIAATFADLGMTPSILTGAADMYRFIAETPIGKETPETRDPNRDLDGVIAALAESLRETSPAS
jgi:3-hydroxyisobutyrate dehydrogenase-like beta-hydroxyacid dehydrogenase